jgi:hypothetical protein
MPYGKPLPPPPFADLPYEEKLEATQTLTRMRAANLLIEMERRSCSCNPVPRASGNGGVTSSPQRWTGIASMPEVPCDQPIRINL